MKLLLGQVHNKGSAKQEVLTLGVIEDYSLGTFIAGSFVATGPRVGRRLADSIWLPKWQVAGGDTVHVHTGKGQNRREPDKDGKRTLHHIYMNRLRPLWKGTRRRAVLIEISSAGVLNPQKNDDAMDSVWGKLG